MRSPLTMIWTQSLQILRKKEAASGRKVVTLSRKPGLTTRWSGRAKNLGGAAKVTRRRST